jgi:hypothetical protein
MIKMISGKYLKQVSVFPSLFFGKIGQQFSRHQNMSISNIQIVFSNSKQETCWFKISVSRNMLCFFVKKGKSNTPCLPIDTRTVETLSIKKVQTNDKSDVKPLHITAPLPLQFRHTAFCVPGLFISAASPFGVQIVRPVTLINVTVQRQARHFRLEGLCSSCTREGNDTFQQLNEERTQ